MKDRIRRALRKFLEGRHETAMLAEAGLKAHPDEYESETIRFTLSPAVGGRILRVTREVRGNSAKNTIGGSYPETTTYIIPSNENIGERVAKIVNLETFKG